MPGGLTLIFAMHLVAYILVSKQKIFVTLAMRPLSNPGAVRRTDQWPGVDEQITTPTVVDRRVVVSEIG